MKHETLILVWITWDLVIGIYYLKTLPFFGYLSKRKNLFQPKTGPPMAETFELVNKK